MQRSLKLNYLIVQLYIFVYLFVIIIIIIIITGGQTVGHFIFR